MKLLVVIERGIRKVIKEKEKEIKTTELDIKGI